MYFLCLQPFVYDYNEDGAGVQASVSKTCEKVDQAEKKMEPMLAKIPLTQKYVLCPKDFKDGYLMELLRSIRDDEIKLSVKVRSMIIFAATIRYLLL